MGDPKNPYCESCKKSAAMVQIWEKGQDGRMAELHLCEECAVSHGKSPKNATVTMFEFLQQWLEKSGAVTKGKDRQCPQCGMTFSDFKVHGRFGCPSDYETFQSKVIPLLDRIHGASGRRGFEASTVEVSAEDAASEEKVVSKEKVSKENREKPRRPAESKAASDLRRLKSELQKVVQKEQYEEAARIRDRIQELERAQKGQEAPDG